MIGGPDRFPRAFIRARRRALVAGVAGLALAALGGAFFGPDAFFRAYLVAWLFWTGIGVGCLAIALMHQLVGGQWGAAIERILEAGGGTVPLMAVAFVPIFFWLPELYRWARPDVVAAESRLQHKAVYLNVPFFVVRAVIYFAVWFLLSLLLDRWSGDRDRTADARFTARLRALGAAGVIVIGFTASFAAFDWIMSLEPDWYSTVYGGMVGVGWMLSAFAFAIAVAVLGARQPPFADVMSDKVRIDLGNLLMTFVILWTYLSFVQLLIIWSGNERDEVVWYVHRLRGGWQGVAIYLAVFQFLVPLFVLLFRAAKRSGTVMAILTMVMLFSHWINIFWLVQPAFSPAGFAIHWLDFLTLIGLGGAWLAWSFWRLPGRPLVPLHDPALPRPEVRYAEP